MQPSAHPLTLARPLMEDVYQFIEGAGAVILLTDSTHCVLDLLGDEPIGNEIAQLGVRRGAFLDESGFSLISNLWSLSSFSPEVVRDHLTRRGD